MNDNPVSPEASVATPLMERRVCGRCGHFHRLVLARKCDCCRDDVRAQPEPPQDPSDG